MDRCANVHGRFVSAIPMTSMMYSSMASISLGKERPCVLVRPCTFWKAKRIVVSGFSGSGSPVASRLGNIGPPDGVVVVNNCWLYRCRSLTILCHSSSSPKSYASSGTLLVRDLVFGGDRCAVSGFWDLLLLSFDNKFGLLVLENIFLTGEYDSREDVVFLEDDDGESSVGDSLGSRSGEVTLGSLLESPGGIGN